MHREPSSLLIDLGGMTDDEAVEATRSIWENEYLQKETRSGKIGVWPAHDNVDVIFHDDRFFHAFYKSKNRSRYPDDKSVFDRERASRIRWIKEVIACESAIVKCWECPGYGRLQDLTRRAYVLTDEVYIVWLIKQKSGSLKFDTAYCSTSKQLRESLRPCRKCRKIPRD